MKIFIAGSHYVEVDENFAVTSPYAVGSAGCVLKLLSETVGPLALKIPLLKATNLGENLLLCELLKTEWRAVDSVSRGRNLSLVQAERVRGDKTLCGELLIAPEAGDPLEINGILAITFSDAGHPIVINSALLEQDRFAKSDILALIKSMLSGDVVSKIKEKAGDIFFFLAGPTSSRAPQGALKALRDGARDEKLERGVFFNVPSVLYHWSPCNLQADVSTELLDSASFTARLTIILRILEAVGSLHERRVLHCDIRPANIFRSHCEPTDGKNYTTDDVERICRSYALGDYGSLNASAHLVSDGQGTFGNTLIGPAVAQLRTSPFYAPERRLAIEFEDANQAKITVKEGKCRVDLNWALYPALKTAAPERIDQRVRDIRPGDSLRLRDFVFTILQVNDDAPSDITISFTCDATVARIVHNRLSVLENLDTGTQSFAISGYVIMRQWSRATDIFSVGVLLLYLLFSKKAGETQTGGAENKSLDTRFAEVLETICAVPYFKAFWQPLSRFAHHVFVCRDKGEPLHDSLIRETATSETMVNTKEFALKITNDLCSSCPHIDIIFSSLSKNSARFLLNIWFAMACIHRSEDLTSDERIMDVGEWGEPFCKSRSDSTNGGGEADRAYKTLDAIRALIDPNFRHLSEFNVATVANFSLQSDYQIRLKFKEAEDLLNSVNAKFSDLKMKLVGAEDKLAAHKRYKDRLLVEASAAQRAPYGKKTDAIAKLVAVIQDAS